MEVKDQHTLCVVLQALNCSLICQSGGWKGIASGLGINQLWQQTPKTLNSPYVNNTGSPILASINVRIAASNNSYRSLTFFVDGKAQGAAGFFPYVTNSLFVDQQLMAVVPSGSQYMLTGDGAVLSWFELR
ncbi:TPA: hypothetical protein L5T32_006232 [Pseudomonas aeruginosa]|nr:hypothetical protein [Pseudomonas aeruginosa]